MSPCHELNWNNHYLNHLRSIKYSGFRGFAGHKPYGSLRYMSQFDMGVPIQHRPWGPLRAIEAPSYHRTENNRTKPTALESRFSGRDWTLSRYDVYKKPQVGTQVRVTKQQSVCYILLWDIIRHVVPKIAGKVAEWTKDHDEEQILEDEILAPNRATVSNDGVGKLVN